MPTRTAFRLLVATLTLAAAPASAQVTPDNVDKLTFEALTASPQRQARLPTTHTAPVRAAAQRERRGYARGYVGNHSEGTGRHRTGSVHAAGHHAGGRRHR